jgi:hypothetical protein
LVIDISRLNRFIDLRSFSVGQALLAAPPYIQKRGHRDQPARRHAWKVVLRTRKAV